MTIPPSLQPWLLGVLKVSKLKNMFTTIKNIVFSKQFIIGFGGLIIIILVYSLIRPSLITPTLLESDPPNNFNKLSTINPIQLEFRDEVINTDFKITSVPEVNWQVNQVYDRVISLSHEKQLTPSKPYLLKIIWKNKEVTTLSYKTEDTQQDYELIKNVKEEIAKNYPLAKLMPYDTLGYSLVYTGPLTLEITLKNPNLKSQEVIDEVKGWVSANGANAEAHKYFVTTN